MAGFVTGMPRLLLRVEGLVVLVAATVIYAMLEAGWWRFAILFLAPDLSIGGYLFGSKVGAVVYNTAHFYALPIASIAGGMFWSTPWAVRFGLIWAAHIGFDRALGYGLKYADGFGSSHLGRIGQSHAVEGAS